MKRAMADVRKYTGGKALAEVFVGSRSDTNSNIFELGKNRTGLICPAITRYFSQLSSFQV